MIYSSSKVYKRLSELKAFCKEHSSYGSSQIDTVFNTLETCISSFYSSDRARLSKQIEEYIKNYFWNYNKRYLECENDKKLGVGYSSNFGAIDWYNDLTLLTTSPNLPNSISSFDFATIMNVDDWSFVSNFYTETLNYGSYTLKNHYVNSWCQSIYGVSEFNPYGNITVNNDFSNPNANSSKRVKEYHNFKVASQYVEDYSFEVDEMVDLLEDRGDPISNGSTVEMSEMPFNGEPIKITVRDENGDHIQIVDKSNNLYYKLSEESTVEGIAYDLYFNKKLAYVIKAYGLYNSDFHRSSDTVYVPTYLRKQFNDIDV